MDEVENVVLEVNLEKMGGGNVGFDSRVIGYGYK